MSSATDTADNDEFNPGYYYDGNSGIVAILTQEGDEIACRSFSDEVSDEPYCTFGLDESPSDNGFEKVPQTAVDNPIKVAEKIYNSGYANNPEVFFNGERIGIAGIEFVDIVTEISLSDRGPSITDAVSDVENKSN